MVATIVWASLQHKDPIAVFIGLIIGLILSVAFIVYMEKFN
jgi:putative Ca2+/H+ antiporter (TMEM165/GDT1 family)